MKFRNLELDRFQQQSIEYIDQGSSVFVSAPTGSGKTLIAEYAVDKALEQGSHIIYTSPIKALSNQKFRDLNNMYPGKVGIHTGDVTLNADAPVLIMTTEILRNIIYDSTERLTDVSHIIFDEVHFIDNPDRGTVWEESIIFAPENIEFICLSATIPNVDEIADWMGTVRNRTIRIVVEDERSVPLSHKLYVQGFGVMNPENFSRKHRGQKPERKKWQDLIRTIIRKDQLPALYFCFSRVLCEQRAEESLGFSLLEDEESRRAVKMFDDLCEQYQVTGQKNFRLLISRGIAYHHAGLMPDIKEVVEQLFASGLIKLIFTTETFAMGINMPARTVIFDDLRKYNGVSFAYITTREYFQMAGRAGRRGMDTSGFVYALIDPFEMKPELVRNVIYGNIESIESQFNLSYSTILSLYSRLGEDIFKIAEKNLSSFQAEKKGRKNRLRRNNRYQKKQLRNRLDFLKKTGYLSGTELTEKGRVASMINGYEIQIAELYSSGLLFDMSMEQLCVIFSSFTYSPRRRDSSEYLKDQDTRRLIKKVKKLIRRITKLESQSRVDDIVWPPDFRIDTPAMLWATGAEFSEVEHFTTISGGDLVRTFRMTVQLLRQVLELSEIDEQFRETAVQALRVYKRDIVDAEAQLKKGIVETV